VSKEIQDRPKSPVLQSQYKTQTKVLSNSFLGTSSQDIMSPDFNRGCVQIPTMKKALSESTSVGVLNKAQYNYKGANNYKLQCKIGEGAVGEVYRAVHK
jgi:hypothetical protein